MHIADVTLFFAPHSGGVKRYLLAKHRHYAARAGVRHSLVVPGAENTETEAGIHSLASAKFPFAGGYRAPLRPWRWRSKLAALAPDLIEVGDPYHLAWAALDAAQACGAATAAFAHSDLPRMLASRFGSVVGRAADRYLRHLYSRFDVVQAPSRLIAERLRHSGIENVVVQPLGVDGDVFHPARREGLLRAQLGLRADTRLLVFAGRMAREKQIPLLLETFAELGAPYHLLIVGGDERRRLSANATLLTYEHDGVRLACLLASADALVHAGAQETFGMIVIEAMACGLPVVGVRGGAVPELIDEGIGALADAGDASGLAEAIDGLYERDLAQLGRQARLRVERRYTWSSTFALQLDRYVRLRHREFDPALDVADATGLP